MTRVLIVEDDPAVRDVVEHALSREGMETETASDGEKAMESLRDVKPFDLVVLDVMLPGMDGISVCQELRNGDSPSTDAPVVILTARDDETSVVVGLEVGTDGQGVRRALAARLPPWAGLQPRADHAPPLERRVLR
jgi:DNA-binding response OmpR family regulator